MATYLLHGYGEALGWRFQCETTCHLLSGQSIWAKVLQVHDREEVSVSPKWHCSHSLAWKTSEPLSTFTNWQLLPCKPDAKC